MGRRQSQRRPRPRNDECVTQRFAARSRVLSPPPHGERRGRAYVLLGRLPASLLVHLVLFA